MRTLSFTRLVAGKPHAQMPARAPGREEDRANDRMSGKRRNILVMKIIKRLRCAIFGGFVNVFIRYASETFHFVAGLVGGYGSDNIEN